MSEWRDATQVRPEVYESVLVVTEEGSIEISMYVPDYTVGPWQSCRDTGEILFWQPLPEKPAAFDGAFRRLLERREDEG